MRRLALIVFFALAAYSAITAFPVMSARSPSEAEIQRVEDMLNDPARLSDLDASARISLLPALRTVLQQSRNRVVEHVLEPAQMRRAEVMDILGQAWMFFAMIAGGFVFVAGMFAGKSSGRWWRALVYALGAAPLFVLACSLLFVPLFGVLVINGALAESLDPQRALVEGMHAVLHESADRLLLQEPAPLAPMAAGITADDPMALERLRDHFPKLAETFRPIVQLVRTWVALGQWIPALLMLATALLFLVGVRSVLLDVGRMPLRAARGEPKPLRRTLTAVARTLWRELGTAFVLCVVVLAMSILAGVAVQALGCGGVRCLLEQLKRVSVELAHQETPAYGSMVAALSAVPVVLMLGILLIAASALAVILSARSGRKAQGGRAGFKASWRLMRPMAQVQWVIPVALMVVGKLAQRQAIVVRDAAKADSSSAFWWIPIGLLMAVLLIAWLARICDAVRTLWRSCRSLLHVAQTTPNSSQP